MATSNVFRTRLAAMPADRRTALRALAAAVAVAWRPANTRAQEATPDAQPLFTGETFVGETSDPETFIAIVLGDPEGEVRPARAYLCNGRLRTIDVWLTGKPAAINSPCNQPRGQQGSTPWSCCLAGG